tara:strand:+ start:397 stop:2616 length:2220 start_codon:yes stop_codon:yes gene_type:complete
MVSVTHIQNRFDAGSISPLLAGQTHAALQEKGLSQCSNMIPLKHGPLTKRGGSHYIAATKYSHKPCVVHEFIDLNGESLLLEIGHHYIRFYKAHLPLLHPAQKIEAITQFFGTQLDVPNHGFKHRDTVVLTNKKGNQLTFHAHVSEPHRLRLLPAHINSDDSDVNVIAMASLPSDFEAITIAKLYEISTPYSADMLFDDHGILALSMVQHGQRMYIAHPKVPPYILIQEQDASFEMRSLALYDGPYLPINNQSIYVTTSGVEGHITVTASQTLFTPQDKGRLIRIGHADHWGFGVIHTVSHDKEVQVELTTPLQKTTKTYYWRLGLWCDNLGWPAKIGFTQDRLILGGSHAYPQTMAMSRTGTRHVFSPSDIDGLVTSTHAIVVTIGGAKDNTIEWFTPFEGGLLVGTSNTHVRITSNDGLGLSPDSISLVRWDHTACSAIRPVSIDGGILFHNPSSNHIHVIEHAGDTDHLTMPDISYHAQHLCSSSFIELAMMRGTHHVMWLLNRDGQLRSLSLDRQSQTLGWSDHHLAHGTVTAITTMPSATKQADHLYMVVKHNIKNEQRYYLEYMAPIDPNNTAHHYLDHAIIPHTINGHTLYGLDHLEGKQVTAIFDQQQHIAYVASGRLILPQEASHAVVGCAYTSVIKSLPLILMNAASSFMEQPKRFDQLRLQLYHSTSMWIGMDDQHLQAVTLEEGYTGDSDATAMCGTYQPYPTFVIKHMIAGPLTLLAMMLRFAVDN